MAHLHNQLNRSLVGQLAQIERQHDEIRRLTEPLLLMERTPRGIIEMVSPAHTVAEIERMVQLGHEMESLARSTTRHFKTYW